MEHAHHRIGTDFPPFHSKASPSRYNDLQPFTTTYHGNSGTYATGALHIVTAIKQQSAAAIGSASNRPSPQVVPKMPAAIRLLAEQYKFSGNDFQVIGTVRDPYTQLLPTGQVIPGTPGGEEDPRIRHQYFLPDAIPNQPAVPTPPSAPPRSAPPTPGSSPGGPPELTAPAGPNDQYGRTYLPALTIPALDRSSLSKFRPPTKQETKQAIGGDSVMTRQRPTAPSSSRAQIADSLEAANTDMSELNALLAESLRSPHASGAVVTSASGAIADNELRQRLDRLAGKEAASGPVTDNSLKQRLDILQGRPITPLYGSEEQDSAITQTHLASGVAELSGNTALLQAASRTRVSLDTLFANLQLTPKAPIIREPSNLTSDNPAIQTSITSVATGTLPLPREMKVTPRTAVTHSIVSYPAESSATGALRSRIDQEPTAAVLSNAAELASQQLSATAAKIALLWPDFRQFMLSLASGTVTSIRTLHGSMTFPPELRDLIARVISMGGKFTLDAAQKILRALTAAGPGALAVLSEFSQFFLGKGQRILATAAPAVIDLAFQALFAVFGALQLGADALKFAMYSLRSFVNTVLLTEELRQAAWNSVGSATAELIDAVDEAQVVDDVVAVSSSSAGRPVRRARRNSIEQLEHLALFLGRNPRATFSQTIPIANASQLATQREMYTSSTTRSTRSSVARDSAAAAAEERGAKVGRRGKAKKK